MRKGFLHVVEIVIVGLMTFLVILQFSYLPTQNIDWASMKLSAQANDILFSLDKKDVDWFDPAQVDGAISSFVSNNTVYALTVRNSMKPFIKVGCICSAAETASIAAALQPFSINGQWVSFSVTQPAPIAFSHEYDVILINDSNMAPYYGQIRQFLDADKGMVEFRHLDLSDIDSVQTDFFGLKWNGSLANPDDSSLEFRSNLSSDTYFNLYKYFHNIPLYQEDFSSITGWNTQIGSWNLNSGNYVGTSGTEAVSYYSKAFNDTYSLRALVKLDTASRAKLILYRQTPDTYVAVELDDGSNTVTVYNNVSGTTSDRGSASYPVNTVSWYDVKAVPQPDSRLMVYINNSLLFITTPLTLTPNTQVGLGARGGIARFDNVRVTFSEGHLFPASLLAGSEKVQPADDNPQKVILLQNSRQLPACIVNSNILDDRGRTAWLAYSDPVNNHEVSNMLRTLVVWAAGDENHVIRNEVKNVPVVTSIYKTYSQDMFQPVEIVLTMGNLYG
jgi:hypothetical protein